MYHKSMRAPRVGVGVCAIVRLKELDLPNG